MERKERGKEKREREMGGEGRERGIYKVKEGEGEEDGEEREGSWMRKGEQTRGMVAAAYCKWTR